MFWIFALLVMLAPLPFGLVHGLGQALYACLVLTLVAGHSLARLPAGPVVPVGTVAPEAVALGLLGLVLGLQLLPLAPAAWVHPLWPESAAALGLTGRGTIYPAPGAAIESMLRLLTYVGVFWLALQWGRDRVGARRLLGAVVVAGTGYALYGLIDSFGDFGRVLWVEKSVAGSDALSSTLINRNSYATLAGFALLCAVGLYLAGLNQALAGGRSGRDRVVHILHQAFGHGAPLLACILVLLTALFLTKSRAGVSSTLFALLFLLIALGLLRKIDGLMARILALMLPLALTATFLLSGEGWQLRLAATDLDREHRLVVYDQTWRAIQTSPWVGHGPGSYAQLFPMYADRQSNRYPKAHNDWLETLFDLGIPASLLWFSLLAGLAARSLAGIFRRRRDRVYPAVAASTCLLAGLHALADFSLQIPAVAITFALLLGVGISQSQSSAPAPGLAAEGGVTRGLFSQNTQGNPAKHADPSVINPRSTR